MWGGLRPIPSRLVLDIATLLSLLYCAVSPPDITSNNTTVLLAAVFTTIATAGLTKRWTLTFPMLPFLVLQGLRRVTFVVEWKWAGVFIGSSSIILIIVAAALSVLFPAVELASPIPGKYNVGIIDLHLPVDFTEGVRRGSLLGTQNQDSRDEPSSAYVTARLLYPTNEEPTDMPYLDPESAPLLCAELMKAGAPGPLKSLSWMLHTWRLTRLRAKRNAQPPSSCEKFPLAIYSHGLTGIAAIYSYQALNLAAQGTVVLMVDHTDQSAIAVKRRDSSHLLYDSSLISNVYMKGNEVEYVRKRRAQTDHRVEECLSALEVLKSLNRQDISDLKSVGVSFVNKLEVSDVTVMGHSFGGSTVLALAAQRPDLVSAVVAHEPAVDWMPDAARRSLFPPEKQEDSSVPYMGGTGGYEDQYEEEKKKEAFDTQDGKSSSIHTVNMLFLYSQEWADVGWGAYPQIKDMHARKHLGPKFGTSDVGVIHKAKHQEFSDTCMLTPVWLARATGLTGERNPHETAAEMSVRTIQFLNDTRSKRKRM